MVDNIEFIEEIKKATSDGQKLSACHKMQIVIKQKQNEQARKKMSAASKKAHFKPITVRWIKNNRIETYDSQDELAEKLGVKKQNLMRSLTNENSKVGRMVQLVEVE